MIKICVWMYIYKVFKNSLSTHRRHLAIFLGEGGQILK